MLENRLFVKMVGWFAIPRTVCRPRSHCGSCCGKTAGNSSHIH